jgi:hypothetical protein
MAYSSSGWMVDVQQGVFPILLPTVLAIVMSRL